MHSLDKNNKFDLIYSFTLFGLLLIIALPSFFHPPVSDYWNWFYSFSHLDEFSGRTKWLHLLNYDPSEQMRYQPLSHLFYYVFHCLFGSNFIFFNIFNFIFYFCSVIILYRFALYFVKNKFLTGAFVGFFALLFSHFDIVLWSNHIYVIAGFSMFLLGFMCYIRFLRISKSYLPFLVILCFLAGMWCYESFFLWPLAILILSRIKSLRNRVGIVRKKLVRANWLILGGVYSVYYLFYLFTRSLGTYEATTYKISDFLKLTNFISSGLSVLFNILYNAIAVNIYPLLAFPLRIAENIYMSGPVINYIKVNPQLIFIEGILVAIALFWFFFSLYRKKYFEEIKIIGLFLFLMLSELYIIFFCRAVDNASVYCLTEFRYQYIPNAFFILTILYIVNRFFKPKKFKQIIIYLVLTPLFILNIYCGQKIIGVYNSQFVDFKKMIFSIRSGISKGLINEDNKIYIDRDMPEYLPSLCWNIEMGERFIKKGNYQWMFSKKEIKYFSEDINDAIWIIDKEEFGVVEKTAENIRKKGKKVTLGRNEQYIETGYFYINKSNYIVAEKMFKKAIELNPKNDDAYDGLRNCYWKQGRYKEAEEMHRKATMIRTERDSNFLKSIIFEIEG